MKVFIANGDSFTAGDEMPDHCKHSGKHSECVWASHLVRYLKVPHFINASWGANSPQAIRRTTIKAVTEVLKAGNVLPEEILVGILWGITSRIEVYEEDSKAWSSVYPTLAASGDKQAKLWYQYFHSEYLEEYNYLDNILSTQLFLASVGVKYFMIPLKAFSWNREGRAVNTVSQTEISIIRDLIDWNTFFFLSASGCENLGFLDWAMENAYETYPGKHLKEDAHLDFVNCYLQPWLMNYLGETEAKQSLYAENRTEI